MMDALKGRSDTINDGLHTKQSSLIEIQTTLLPWKRPKKDHVQEWRQRLTNHYQGPQEN